MTEDNFVAKLKKVRQEFARSGGLARAKALTAKQREDIARKASQARWRKARRGK